HAVYCLKYAGVPCLLTENCARIYYRNCISNAYPVLFINGLSKAIADGDIKDGDELEVNMDAGVIKDLSNGKEFHGDAVSDLERDIMAAGGIFQYMKQQAAKK
ncbi:MAG: 3-isopropylmalate dehydratase small subunit, partial [Firmicutes bacterium]|nr:3-isopropylmalate dehydratase small subunit [Bacillota bacterium]